MAKKKSKSKVVLKVIPLGGLNEVGKNLTVLECKNDIIVIDCGLSFPDDDMMGIDLVIPDVSYLEKNKERIKGIVLTHGHEDHIGALPYLIDSINAPIYATKLTIGILQNKFQEHNFENEIILNTVNAGDRIVLGCFKIEFIHVNHSIADACALAIYTPVGTVVHSGDFKIDLTPIEGEIIDLTRFGEIGKEGVLLYMGESTNAEREGYTPSEKNVGKSLDDIFMKNPKMRIVVATFSSNVHRVQQIIDTSVRYGRKVAISGRSMANVVAAAIDLGYMDVPEDTIIDITDLNKYPKEKTTIITTGSQGEPMSSLYRMVYNGHNYVDLGPGDLVVLSSHAIPGNEKLIGKIVNELLKKGVEVYRDSFMEVHVSGHACKEELKMMFGLLKPCYFMPIHGEYKHLYEHRKIALEMGVRPENIFVSDIGKCLEFDEEGTAKWGTSVSSGRVLVDGSGVGDVGNVVLRDRKHLSQDGLIVIVATISIDDMCIISGPDIISRGFVYVKESEELMEEMRNIAKDIISNCLDNDITDHSQIKTKVKDEISRFLFAKTKRKPMVLSMVMNV